MTTALIYDQIFAFLNRVKFNFSIDAEFLSEAATICSKMDLARCDFYASFLPDVNIEGIDATHIRIFDSSNPFVPDDKLSFCYTNDTIGDISIDLFPCADILLTSEHDSVYRAFADLIYMYGSRTRISEYVALMTHYDIQTGLPNMNTLKEYYESLQHNHCSQHYAVIYMNLQNFKYINQVGGSKVGDLALVKYAEIISDFVSKDELIARIVGDNFLVLLRKEHLDEFLDRIEDVVLTNLPGSPDRLFHVSAWCGICPDDLDDSPLDIRVDRALNALQFAKTKLFQKTVYYSDKLYDYFSWSKKVIGSFKKCLEAGEFIPYYQPKVHIPTGKIIGLEALVRWQHKGGIIFPDKFIPIIEANAMIPQLDLAILKATCEHIRSWQQMGITPPIVSVNMSRKDLYVPEIEETVHQIIKNAGISTEFIEIEITENINEEEYDRLVEFLHKIKSYGIKISIDDFGTGYSSLSLLKNIEPDILKIDKSFVHDCMIDKRSVILIQKIIELANCLNISVIAEGVEAKGQAEFLLRVGCQNAQGYLYDQPLTYEMVTGRLQLGDYTPLESMER